jgi:outer membrane protein OmpA-like peptidoglycan-associated protein
MAFARVSRWKKTVVYGTAIALIPTLGPGCKTDTGKGAMIGGGGGALIGALIDHSNPWAGALIGAAGGALIGAAIGHHMDKAKQDLEKQLAPEINAGQITMELLPGHAVQISMTWQTAFSQNSAVINPNFIPTLQKIGSIVGTYGKMTVTCIGYPDVSGTVAQQKTIAFQRAEAVRVQLIGMGVKPVLVIATDHPGSPITDGRVQIILTPIQSQ